MHCLRASLSEQDFESVGGASVRDGLRRVIPSWEKYCLPGSERCFGKSQGVGSSCADIVNSMLASPPWERKVSLCVGILVVITYMELQNSTCRE